MRHVILTRLNVPITGWARNSGWIRRRIALFQRYTLRSMRAQTCSDFEWWVFVADRCPQVQAKVPGWLEGLPQLRVREVASQEAMLGIVKGEIAAGPVVTTRLDSDDGVTADFVERIQQAASRCKKRTVLNFGAGIVFCDRNRDMRLDHQPSNPFTSMAEPDKGLPLSIWGAPHGQLPQLAEVQQLPGIAWLQVIHGDCLANRLRGKRIGALPPGVRMPALDKAAPAV